ncbi:hypothetical protein MMC30_005677 [Trapelia coarctata]|nr:hypothetical protein [Trapelia coarctata]
MKITTTLLCTLMVLSFGVATTADYDDLPGGSVALLAPSPSTYKNLTYNGWVVFAASPVALGGFKSQTPPNRLVTSPVIEAQQGGVTPSMTVASPYRSFTASDFYFGCATNAMQNVATVATGSTINVSGFAKTG